MRIKDTINRCRQVLASSVFGVFSTSAVIMALGLVNSIVLGRILGPSGRGEIAAAILWPTQFLFFSSMGLLQAIVFYSALPDARPNNVSSNALMSGFLQSLVAACGGYFVIPKLLGAQSPAVVAACRMFLLALPFYMLHQYGQNLLQGRMCFKAMNRQRMILPVGYIAGVVLLAALHKLTLINVIYVQLIFHGSTTLYSWVEIWRNGIFRSFAPDLRMLREMLKFGGKIYPGELTGTLNLRMDQMLLAFWFPAAELGVYVAAVSGAGVSEVMSYAFRVVTSPKVASQQTWEQKTFMLRHLFKLYILSSVLFSAGLMLLMPIAIPLLFGHAFARAVPVSEVLLMASFCLGARNLLAGGSQALGDAWLNSKAELIAVPVTVGMLLLLLPRFGIMGAAVSTFFAYATQLAVVLSELHRKHGISLLFLLGHAPPKNAISIRASAGGDCGLD